MTEAERIEATANRVGLSGPQEYDSDNPRPLPSNEAEEGDPTNGDPKGSLQTMWAPQQ
jgi:hypothetical protein